MNFRAILVIALVFSSLPFQAWATEPKNLQECFQAALKRSELLLEQHELVVQAHEKYRQAFGGVLPHLNAEASYLRRDPPETSSGQSSFTRKEQYVAKLNATQPLYQGFREFSAMRQTKATQSAGEADWRQQSLDLYRQVSENFYTIISLEKEIDDVATISASYSDRTKELRQRIRIGRSRLSEVLLVDASLAKLRADEAQLRGLLLTARAFFTFLTDFEQTTPLKDTFTYPDQIAPLEDYLSAIERRPDVQAEKDRLRAAQYAVRYEQAGHHPFLGLEGNAYAVNSDSLDNPDRDSMWDVKATLTLPIFSGGATQARVRERKSQKRQAELELQRKQRQASEEIKALYQTFLSNQEQLRALIEATDISKRNYEVQTKDYRLGLVNNVDVLLALTDYQTSIRELDRFQYLAKVNLIRLETAAAREPDLSVPKPGDAP